MADWIPFGLTEREAEAYAVLRSDLSLASKQSVVAWILPLFDEGGGLANSLAVRRLQLVTDTFLGVGPTGARTNLAGVTATINQLSDVQILRLADYALSQTSSVPRQNALELILKAARSKWTVGTRMGRPGLMERVPVGVQEFAESAISSSGKAGSVLSRAWTEIHGLEQQPSAAYADAVVAVEIVAVAAVQPSNSAATLGTVIAQMELRNDWRLPLREHGKAPSAELVIAMLRTLWYGHRDRHGKADYSSVSPEEARAAVSLAVVAVDWFASGVLARRPLT